MFTYNTSNPVNSEKQEQDYSHKQRKTDNIPTTIRVIGKENNGIDDTTTDIYHGEISIFPRNYMWKRVIYLV